MIAENNDRNLNWCNAYNFLRISEEISQMHLSGDRISCTNLQSTDSDVVSHVCRRSRLIMRTKRYWLIIWLFLLLQLMLYCTYQNLWSNFLWNQSKFMRLALKFIRSSFHFLITRVKLVALHVMLSSIQHIHIHSYLFEMSWLPNVINRRRTLKQPDLRKQLYL